MKKTKKKILDRAHLLFNEQGVSNVSLRQIAAEVGISHSNLIYHFKTKQEIIRHLHQRILDAALEENQRLKNQESIVEAFYESTLSGFRILYDYRFFMIDLNVIMREDKQMHAIFLEVEKVRSRMYEELIQKAIQEKIMRPEEYTGEYEQLIKHIRIFSDFWISSAEIYDEGEPEKIITAYAQLLLALFFPYLTHRGQNIYFQSIPKL